MNVNIEKLKTGYVVLITDNAGNIEGHAVEKLSKAQSLATTALMNGNDGMKRAVPDKKPLDEEEDERDGEGVDLL